MEINKILPILFRNQDIDLSIIMVMISFFYDRSLFCRFIDFTGSGFELKSQVNNPGRSFRWSETAIKRRFTALIFTVIRHPILRAVFSLETGHRFSAVFVNISGMTDCDAVFRRFFIVFGRL
jgi:hypothetical protein